MKFQKSISVWLSILLLVSQFGLTMNMHYCGGEVRSIDFSTNYSKLKKDKSCCGMKEESSSCCKNKKVLLQKKIDSNLQKSFSFSIVDFTVPSQIQTPILMGASALKQNTFLQYYCDSHAPPLYQLYSQYIFYELV
ncbi:MAG: hypothetical protein U0X58_10625 [Flavobacteriaceae bacterium]